MNRSWRDTLRNYALIQRLGTFMVTLLVIAVFLPKEQLFKYEYQLNQPWKHDKLLAPFDFGIHKTKDEIQARVDELKADQPPVFVIDEELTNRIISEIDHAVTIHFPDSAMQCATELKDGLQLIGGFLNGGLVERNHESIQPVSPFKEVYVFDGNMLDKAMLNKLPDINTIMTAADSFSRSIDTTCGPLFISAVRDHLEPNALYSDSMTALLLDRAIDEIITIEGNVSKGTTIIDKGDIVSKEGLRIIESLRLEYENRTLSGTNFKWSFLGEIGIVFTLLALLVLFIQTWQSKIFNDPRPLTLALGLITVLFVMTRMAVTSTIVSIYVIPIGIAPLLLRMFYDFTVSLFTMLILVLILALFSANPLEFTIIQVSAISIATLYQASSTRRSKTLGTALLVFLGYAIIYVFISVAQNGSLNAIDTGHFGWFAINALLCTLVFPLIYVVEKIFGYVSETTLLELSDSNQPLLKELATKAPGTFQHSLQVANLCEKVSAKIGGNSVLLRTAALYHDIGKMNEPQFFIENQIPDNNPHDDLEPEESAAIIINHVTKGVELARNAKIPMEVVQFIRTHHGTSRVRFFLKKAQEKAANPEDVDEGIFRYPGPTPKTKEQAILMMCDSVEAASRTLKKYDHDSINNLVNGIVDTQRREGQFEEAPITLKDISESKAVLIKSIKGIYHQRISYD
ncbi:MAG: HDIG domain-containing protein [Flavobacteriales bacterium]